MFSDHNGILPANITEKWLQNAQIFKNEAIQFEIIYWANKKNTREIRKFWPKLKWEIIYQYFQDAFKEVLSEKFITLNEDIGKTKKVLNQLTISTLMNKKTTNWT